MPCSGTSSSVLRHFRIAPLRRQVYYHRMALPSKQDIRNAALRRAVAERQRVAWNECLRMAEAALGGDWNRG
jgi:hypothetical protein